MIKYLELKAVTAQYADEIHEAISRVVDGGWYLQGEETKAFEAEYAKYIGTRHCIGVGNGLDALTLIIRAYKEMGAMADGDEVIVPANTYIASILAISENGLKPVLVEPRLDTFEIDDSLIEQAITPRTRAIMIVHLYGYCAYTERIGNICKQYNLKLIEDNAQAHGCRYPLKSEELGVRSEELNASTTNSNSKSNNSSLLTPHSSLTGAFGSASAHSFYPGKNLGALGDAGAVTTDDDQLATTIRAIANYGSSRKYVFDYCGRNSRIDELQAAVLRVKLRHLDEDNERRRGVALRYSREINNENIIVPSEQWAMGSVNHIYPILCPERDKLQQYLADNGVQTVIHYPIPPHRQRCYAQWASLSLPVTERIHREELSLPCNQTLSAEEVEKIINLTCIFS